MQFSQLLDRYDAYRDVAAHLEQSPVNISGIVEAAQPHLVSSLCTNQGCGGLVVTYSDMEAKLFAQDLEFFYDNVLYFPSKEYVFYNIETTGHQNEHQRLSVLEKLVYSKEPFIVVASLDALMQYTADARTFSESSLTFTLGAQFDLELLSGQLVHMGYTREDLVEGRGQFSIRGGILDVFTPHMEYPVRIEFFDDETDSIRCFDPDTQRSLDKLDSVTVIPAVEAIYTKSKRAQMIAALEKQLKKAKDEHFIETVKTDIENFNERHYFPSVDKYISMVYDHIPSLPEYLNPESLVFLIDPKRLSERGKTFGWEKGEIITELKEKGILPTGKMEFWKDYHSLLDELLGFRVIAADVLSHTSTEIKYRYLVSFTTKTTVSFHGKVEYLYDDLQRWREKKTTVVILAQNRGRGENLAGVLREKGIECRYEPEDQAFEEGQVAVVRGALNKGFEYPEINFVLISDHEIFEAQKSRSRRKIENTNRIKSYTDISVGDYVVHQSHGIGQYMGTQKMVVGGITKDYLKIKYHGTDHLYVPIDQLNLLYKYVGNTEKQLKLNRLGGSDWNKTKQRVRAATADMAKQLIALYAAREKTKGYAFSPDTAWQREFEDTFPYQETEDQMRSIEEVKQDMESDRPMDRLLCGDVGYGKTEVALRAAFKAVNDSKQVAYLCPTTILAMQHYNTFCRRMENFPVRVEMLSRFRTAAQQKKILKQLKSGEIDVLIGTHRLLQKDVVFKDLGLLIVDEEQRFGVAHKERLKEIKQNIDVLTMTATPIPRTLHMAMINVRDMSVLSQPPENRYPVQTYVLEDNPFVITDAIKNELARGGQVYYLFNRVQGIYRKAEWIKSQVPGARVSVGHGKMKEDELEDIMYDMVNGESDVLVCTTIIETGLDIPNANTIIIENADKMGLAQLYQLRGRVGRSNRAAYAYLTYRRDGVLSDIAQKRLRAVKEFTEFGSGFKIAMRDLEIRGAGDILGAQQHGHMDSVGYDMYCKLLKESVDEAQGKKVREELPITIDLDIDAYLPEEYIRNHNQRIDLYKKIAAIETEDDRFEIEDELIDRYGDIPRAAQNVIEVASVKILAKQAGIFEVTQKSGRILLKFEEGILDASIVLALDQKYPEKIRLVSSEKPELQLLLGQKKEIIKTVRTLLELIAGLRKTEEEEKA